MKPKLESGVAAETLAEELTATLQSPEHQASMRLVKARAVSAKEVLKLSSLRTPNGSMFRVGIETFLTGEELWSDFYREEVDALAVWQNLADSFEVEGDKSFRDG